MKKTTLLILITSSLMLVLCCGAAAGLWYLFSPVSAQQKNTSFVVTKGDTLTSIAEKLASQGIVRNSLGLRIVAKLSGQSLVIQPGSYLLSAHMGPRDIIQVLLSETQDVWVTLKEGWRAEEIATEVGQKLTRAFDPDEFIQLATPLEGRLFPDTYLLSKEMTSEAVFSKLTQTFEDRYAKVVSEVGQGVWPKKETLIVASLVEREGRGATDTQMIAGIIKNRLDAKMPLQIDATLQYAQGYDQERQTWWGVPTREDKETDSPYNTYQHPGLPPTPICNPGLVSIKAALAPTKSDYLFYLHDKQGKPHYAKDYAEHQKNIEAYLR